MTLPGFESDTGAPQRATEGFGLSGRWLPSVQPSDVDVIKKSRVWLIIAGAICLGLVGIYAVWPDAQPIASVEHTLPASAQEDVAAIVAPGSLVLELADLTDRWNEVADFPKITGGLIKHPETGQFDSFTYRFSNSSLLAGAYDPSNDYVYALMASSWLSDPSTPHMSVHLCHLVEPYSQACLDAFRETGLAGQPVAAYVDMTYEAEWAVGDIRWRLAIADNIQTIRVLGPGAG